jgi:hypothetical protein
MERKTFGSWSDMLDHVHRFADLSGVPAVRDASKAADGHVKYYQDMMAKARSTQVGGDHYAKQKIQPWDALEAWLTPEQLRGHFLASAVQYLARYNADAPGKGGLDDVKKAAHYLEKLIELEVAK